MIKYDDLKNWLKEKSNQKVLIIIFGYVVIFFVGFGSGSFVKVSKQKTNKVYSNNSIITDKKPENKALQTQAQPQTENADSVLKPTKTETVKSDCLIKGNIASGGKKIYHLKTGAYYQKVKAEMCFNTEDEAKQAGFTKSAR
jgi:flagellar basal body-associated protein FliL